MTQSGRQSVGWSFIRSVCQSACRQVVLISWFYQTGIRRTSKQDSGKAAFSGTYQNDVSIIFFLLMGKNQPVLSVGSKR